MRAWIGVDLDGTLAQYEGFHGPSVIGAPIPEMLKRVKMWLAEGKDVRIFTARVWEPGITSSMPAEEYNHRRAEAREARQAIKDWCRTHVGRELPITCEKDYGMVVLYDDRAVQVEANTGRIIGEEPAGLR